MLKIPPFLAFVATRFGVASGLAIAALAVFSSPSRAAVFGNDDRKLLTKAEASLEDKIGTLVSSETGAYCTAFCVAPDMIATASHCLFGTAATKAPKLKNLYFKLASAPETANGTPIAERSTGSQSQNVISGTTRLSVAPPIGAAQDWVVATLAAPACKSGGLALSQRPESEIRAAASRGEIYQIAVHADLPDTNLRRGGPCAVSESFPNADEATISRDFANPGAILFHTCDTAGGSSGSPLLIDTPNGPEVAGINVGTYVLSRNVTTSQDQQRQSKSEPIANTAIWIAAIAGAVAEMEKR
jgi:V8-like Glu-specific endopeptidase